MFNVNGLMTAAQLYPLIVSVMGLGLMLLHQYHKYRQDLIQDDSIPPVSPRSINHGRTSPRPPDPGSSHRDSAADGRATTVSATTSSSIDDDEPARTQPDEPDPGFPPGWSRHEDTDGRIFWLPEGQTPRDQATGPEYPARARTVR